MVQSACDCTPRIAQVREMLKGAGQIPWAKDMLARVRLIEKKPAPRSFGDLGDLMHMIEQIKAAR